MKLVLLSDIHGNLKKCRLAVKMANRNNASIIVAGDLMNWELKHPDTNFKKQLNILSKCRKKAYIIPGSHEEGKLYKWIGSHKLSKYDNLVDLNRKIIDLKTHYLIGYGGSSVIEDSIISKSYYRSIPEDDELMLNQLLSIKGKPVIFVSHDPPYSYLDTAIFRKLKLKNKKLLGIEPAEKGEKGAIEKSVGQKVLKKLAEKHKPLLYLFGHIHESAGYEELITHKAVKVSKHLLINAGIENVYLADVNKNWVKILGITRV